MAENTNPQGDLGIVRSSIHPTSQVSYMSEVSVSIDLGNNTDQSIEINSIACSMAVEESLAEHKVTISVLEHIAPKGVSATLRIPLTIDLSLRPNTNFPVIAVEYKIGSSSKKILFKQGATKYLIIRSTHPPETKFFLSHKDPEDRYVGSRHDYYLKKVGFQGYMAEHNQLPGIDIWNEKIYPSIDGCLGLVVLWTEAAAKKPDMILREVEYAKNTNKRIVAIVEEGVKIPDILSDKEHIPFSRDEHEIIKSVKAVYDAYKRGVFRAK